LCPGLVYIDLRRKLPIVGGGADHKFVRSAAQVRGDLAANRMSTNLVWLKANHIQYSK
jgi:hypothetical protein